MEKKYYTVTVRDSNDKESIIHDLMCNTEGLDNIPDRECTCEDLKKYSKFRSTFHLTEQEAEDLKNDCRVKSINLDGRFHEEVRDEIVYAGNKLVFKKDFKKSPFYEYKYAGQLGDGNIVYEEIFLEEKYQQDIQHRKRRQEIIDNKRPEIVQKINLHETFNLHHEIKKPETYKISIDNDNKNVLVEGDYGYKKYFNFKHYLNRARIEVDNLILNETDSEGNMHERWYSISGNTLMMERVTPTHDKIYYSSDGGEQGAVTFFDRYNTNDYPIYSAYGTLVGYSEYDEFRDDPIWYANANTNTRQLYRLQQKENPWVIKGLSANEFIQHSPSNPIQHKGAGEDVDLIVIDDGAFHASVEFNQNAINAKNPRDYRTGNALREITESNGENGTCNILDIYLDSPALIDPDFFYNSENIDEKTYERWDGTRIAVASASIDWWNNNSLDSRSSKYVSPENGGTATGDNDFGELFYSNYDRLRDQLNSKNNIMGDNARLVHCGDVDFGNQDHGTECASLAYGRTQGWAYNCNKWSISLILADYNTILESVFDVIKTFHKIKPTPSNRNEKNPTVCSASWGVVPSLVYPMGGVVSGDRYLTFRGETLAIPGSYPRDDQVNYLKGMQYTQVEFDDDSITQAGDELIEAGVFWFQASGNGNSNMVKPDHPNFNNFIHKELSAVSPGPPIPRLGRNVFYTTSRRGFPMHLGKTENYEYPVILVGAIDDFIFEGKEIKGSFSTNGNSIDIYAPAGGTLAANTGPTDNNPNDYRGRVDSLLPISDLHRHNKNFGGTSAACPVAAGFLSTLLAHHRDWDWRDLKKWINEELKGQPSDQFYNEGVDPDSVDDPEWVYNPVPSTAYDDDYGSINTFLPDGELPKVPYLTNNF